MEWLWRRLYRRHHLQAHLRACTFFRKPNAPTVKEATVKKFVFTMATTMHAGRPSKFVRSAKAVGRVGARSDERVPRRHGRT
jgi:hypothetical protein